VYPGDLREIAEDNQQILDFLNQFPDELPITRQNVAENPEHWSSDDWEWVRERMARYMIKHGSNCVKAEYYVIADTETSCHHAVQQ